MTDSPLIIIEERVPFARGVLESVGCRVRYLAAEAIDREAVAEADALIVRTRTRCDAALLEGSKVRLVCTATIGTDHIDKAWCAARGIAVANAAGCNAPAVAQYVMATIATLTNRPVSQLTLGIVGVGNVGRIVERWARALDMRVLVNDPPRQAAEGGSQWSTLEEIARRCDVVTVHTPLTRSGEYATAGLLGGEFFARLHRSPLIINAARGGIVNESALLEALAAGRISAAAIDCWENEPEINTRLLAQARIATPHIAGYSRQGKIRATAAALQAVCSFFGLPAVTPDAEAPEPCAPTVTVRAVLSSYDPLSDTAALREAYARRGPAAFEQLRNTYALRPESPAAPID